MAKRRPTKKASHPANEPVSLVAFMKGKVRSACPICALPVEIRRQLGRVSTKRGITRQDQVEWLRNACHVKEATLENLTKHVNGKHDSEEDLHDA